ncbi:uncharacterized protein TNCT_42991 [Trichonephila clavata]|uniref:Nucleotide exchange factor SIL1 n=1 Tax=Trichonephila clavata TaxID=2740835 RepID=A0A8X6L1P3_TRICU|nr:uncharacterized protein TNCT_42991 [Trichonephila clavata]
MSKGFISTLTRMKLILLILGALMFNKVIICKANAPMIVLGETEEKHSGGIGYQGKETLSSKDLKDVYDMAKNISHSKGSIIKSKEGDFEYRRSLVRKISLATKSEALKKWIKSLQRYDKYTVEALQELEYLVHQYETASDFVKLGGLELILSLINNEDPSLASTALSVLSAALQGNPPVQKYAEEIKISDYLTKVLRKGPPTVLSSALFTLSSYLRNNEKSQINFFRMGGLTILADILTSSGGSLKSKLKVIDLLNDLAIEIYDNLDVVDQAHTRQLQRVFYDGFKNTKICEEIPTFFKYSDYTVYEKVVIAMNSLHHVCLKDFKKKHVIDSIERLAYLCIPNVKLVWLYPNDLEIQMNICDALQTLLDNVMSTKFLIKTEL